MYVWNSKRALNYKEMKEYRKIECMGIKVIQMPIYNEIGIWSAFYNTGMKYILVI